MSDEDHLPEKEAGDKQAGEKSVDKKSTDKKSASHQPAGAVSPGEQSDSAVAKQSDQNQQKSPRRGGGIVAALALIVALGAAGLAGWQWWLAQVDEDGPAPELASTVEEQTDSLASLQARTDELSQRLQKTQSGLEEAQSRLDELTEAAESSSEEPEALRRELQSAASDRKQIQQRLSTLSDRLDTTVSDFEARLEETGTVRSDRVESLMDQADRKAALMQVAVLLRLGRSRIEMADDREGALAAYRSAKAQLGKTESGSFERLRQLLAQELQSLESMQMTDWPALIGRLAALEQELESWPLRNADGGGVQEQAAGDEQGDEGWWSGLRDTMGGLVRVTPRESAPLTPAAAESVRTRLELHLAAAQAAAARRNGEELRLHLKTAEELVRARFDTASQAVERGLTVLSEVASAHQAPTLPELGGALAEAERRISDS